MVLASLVGILTVTSAVLRAIAPDPLVGDGSAASLLAMENSLDKVLQTVPSAPGRWKYIFVHHTRTPAGNAAALAQQQGALGDHFVLGNGRGGSADGQIEIAERWIRQLPAAPPPGAADINPACISITVIGDFDKALPTPMQMERLGQLVSTLQARYRISSDNVLVIDQKNSPAGIGQYFPTTAFRDKLLP